MSSAQLLSFSRTVAAVAGIFALFVGGPILISRMSAKAKRDDGVANAKADAEKAKAEFEKMKAEVEKERLALQGHYRDSLELRKN